MNLTHILNLEAFSVTSEATKMAIKVLLISISSPNLSQVVASLGREINLNPPLVLGQLPDTSEELLKLDQVCMHRGDRLGNEWSPGCVILAS